MTLTELTRRFPDEATAKAHLFSMRWPDGKVACPRCRKAEKIYRRAPRKGDGVPPGFSLLTGGARVDQAR